MVGYLADLGEGPDTSEVAWRRADLPARPDEDHPKRSLRIDAAPDHELVAGLEDLERERHSRTEHCVEGEERQSHLHVSSRDRRLRMFLRSTERTKPPVVGAGGFGGEAVRWPGTAGR